MGSAALATPEFELAFRFAREPDADEWLRDETRRVLEALLSSFGRARVRAIIVSGSLARGEGGLGRWNGGTFPVADLDLYVVARTPQDAVVLREARHGFLAAHEGDSLRTDVGVATESDLAAMPDTIANFSLGRDGKVAWGDPSALGHLRNVDAARIPREDAINLVLNRAAEELAALRSAENEPDSRAKALVLYYRGVKTVADVGLAILLRRGVCEPAYGGRGERVAAALDDDPRLAAEMPAAFAADVERACEWKLAPRAESLDGHVPGTPNYPEFVRRCVAARAAIVRGFCRWYTAGADDFLSVLATSEPFGRAARNWVRHARRSSAGRRALIRRLAGARLRPTPKLSSQLAALAVYLAWDANDADASWRRAECFFSEPPSGDGRGAWADAAVCEWEREIMNRRRA
ncbi:MAG: hypothetical protein ACKVU1_08735 [bacterium]